MRIFPGIVTVYLAATVLFSVALADSGESTNLSDHPVRFAIIGDRTGEAVEGVYGAIIEEIERLKPDFVMTVGDMIEGYTEDTAVLVEEWQEYLSLLEPLTMPIYHTPGNHDITTDPMEGMYRRYMGDPYYSFDHRGLHFVILDNSRVSTGDDLSSEQMKWLSEDLSANQESVYTMVFVHKPYWFETVAVGKPHALHTLLVEHGVDAVFTGHYHRYFVGEYDGITYTSMGSSGGGMRPGPSGLGYHFAWVTVSDEGMAIAPIRNESVLPWNEATADDMHIIDDLDRKGLEQNPAVPVSGGSSISDMAITITVQNLSDYVMEDSLRWDVPDSWKVEPQSAPVTVPPKSSEEINFSVSFSGDLYPVPTVAANFPYTAGKSYETQGNLRVTREVVCGSVTEPPKIDGILSEDIWQTPETRFYSPNGEPTRNEPVEFYFAHDEANLYLAAHCTESKVDSIRAAVTERDGAVYGEDCVGYLFCPKAADGIVYLVYFNPNGIVFDQKIVWDSTGYYDADPEWNGSYEIMTRMGEDFWNVEVKIPLSEFGDFAAGSSVWDVNFRRKQKRLNSSGDWQVPRNYDPKTFGEMTLQ